MNDIIKLLPDSVANQIAAGEVIQRPASVIKELVENAVDAGATDIKIILKDAGRTLIQVVDNGSGMSETDARMAFERHATSKIDRADDLYTLHTMGFRGEALASIAAVAQIEMRTMRASDSVGTRILINGSQVESQEPVATTAGTSIAVKNLFYTVPARRKFLKKDSVELSAIIKEFERLALVNPQLSFSVWHNDLMIHQLTGSSLKKRICDLFGKNLDKQLLPVETDTSMVRIDGFISLPANARKRNALQYLLVNGRNMRHPVFHKAILECYQELIPQDSQPNYFISFTVEPSSIDVNIHPTKNEIKFENEFGIRQILMAAVKESLGKFNAMPGIEFDTDDAPDIPVFNPNENGEHGVDVDPDYNPFRQGSNRSASNGGFGGGFESQTSEGFESHTSRGFSSGGHTAGTSEILSRDWEKLYDEFAQTRNLELDKIGTGMESAMNAPTGGSAGSEEGQHRLELSSQSPESGTAAVPAMKAVQIAGTWLVAPCKSGMMVIDQHRAHIRVLYERLLEGVKRNEAATQSVLFPEVAQLTPHQNVILESMTEEVTKAGFDLMPLGDNAWSINGVPSTIGDTNPAEVLAGIIAEAEVSNLEGEVDTLSKRLALGMAKSTAIKRSTRLNDSEISRLLQDLFLLPTPNFTPDGLKVITIIGNDELADLFTR